MNINDLTHKRFGMLFVESRHGTAKGGQATWNCICDCGVKKIYAGYVIKLQQSCGCLKSLKIKNKATKHGMTNSPEFRIWSGIRNRCKNKNSKDYKKYGGIGIYICKQWDDSFEKFYNDMGSRPSDKHSIDRINNLDGYFKENCRWATITEQNSNKKSNIYYEGKTLANWSRELGVSTAAISYRMKKFNNPYGEKNV